MYFVFSFLEHQENISGSPARTPLAQQQTSIEPNNLSNVQGGNETNETEPSSPQLENDNIVNQQSPIDSHDFSQIMNMNPLSDSNMPRSEGHTFRPSNQIQNQNKERSDNLSDLSQIMNMNLFSEDDSQQDQQSYENQVKSTKITTSIDEI